MLKKNITAETVEAGLRDMAECNKLIDLASKQALLDNKASIRDTEAFQQAQVLVEKTCGMLGVPVPAFFRSSVPPIFH